MTPTIEELKNTLEYLELTLKKSLGVQQYLKNQGVENEELDLTITLFAHSVFAIKYYIQIEKGPE